MNDCEKDHARLNLVVDVTLVIMAMVLLCYICLRY